MNKKIDDRKKAIFVAKKMFAQLVYDFQSLEGMPFTFPEVKTLIQGITVGGHKISDQEKLNQQQLAWKTLIDLVKQNQFDLSEKTSCTLEGIAAKDEALEPGVIRNGAVPVRSGDFTYYPPEDEKQIRAIFTASIQEASDHSKPVLDRAYKLAVDYAYNQFHWDGNKRTGNLMMNGLLLDSGILPCPIPAKRLKEYNTALMKLYRNGDYKPVIDFHRSCHKELYREWKMKYPENKKTLSAVDRLNQQREGQAKAHGRERG